MGENKTEYIVENKRRHLWEIELSLFEQFRTICKQHSLKYFLIGGSAIGAVRHGGFIPWDDDLDIGMLREDFEKLVSHRSEFSDNCVVEYGLNEDCTEYYFFCRIRDKNSTGMIRGQNGRPGTHGVFIEIYPFDAVPKSRLIRKIQWTLSKVLIGMISYRVYHEEDRLGKKIQIINRILKFVPTTGLFHSWEKVCKLFNGICWRYVDTVSIPSYSPSEVDFFLREDVEEVKCVPFEEITACIPVGNDRCLRKTYGDYMQLPPISERGTHHNSEVYYDPDRPYTEYSQEFFDEYFGRYDA